MAENFCCAPQFTVLVTLRRACVARGQVIALGLAVYIYMLTLQKNVRILQNTHFQKSTPIQEGFSSNLIASSTPQKSS